MRIAGTQRHKRNLDSTLTKNKLYWSLYLAELTVDLTAVVSQDNLKKTIDLGDKCDLGGFARRFLKAKKKSVDREDRTGSKALGRCNGREV